MDNDKAPLSEVNGKVYSSVQKKSYSTVSIIVDKNLGLVKYGDESEMTKYYKETTDKFKAKGYTSMADDLMYVKFVVGKNLTAKEICTFINYMLMVSANEKKIVAMLGMNVSALKAELGKLAKSGF